MTLFPHFARVSRAVVALGVVLAGGLWAQDKPTEAAAKDGGGLTVRQFGAVGDGKADDTEAIVKAIHSGQGSVVFPKGVYRLTRSIEIPLAETGFVSLIGDGTARILMEGKGAAFHFIGTHEGSAGPDSFKPGVWEKERMPMVRGLEIVGPSGGQGKDAKPGEIVESDGIQATGVMQLTILDTRLSRLRHGIHLTKRDRNILVSNCHIYENTGCGIFYDQVNLHQSNIVGSHISYNKGGGIVFRGGEVRNVHIGTCDIESNMTPDVPETANVLIDCTGGSTAEVAITGCTIQHNSKSPGSANIRVLGKGITSVKKATDTQEGHITITGNVFSDVMTNIHLDHARGVSIVGNTFWEGFEQDLLLENCQAIVIGPNDFDRNPRYVVNGNWAKEKNGIVLRKCKDVKLNGALIKGVWGQQAAVVLDGCERCTVSDCSILDSDGIGLWLKDCKRCVVSNCVIDDEREGEAKKGAVSLKVEGGEKNWVKGNVLGNGVEGGQGNEGKAVVFEGNWAGWEK